MTGDILLTWMSESGIGTVSDFRSRAEWLVRLENNEVSDFSAWRWLRNASALGHCEVDWQRGTWAVAPPAIASLPLADGWAVLVGSRRPRLLRAIRDADIYFERAVRPGRPSEIPPAATILFPFENTHELESYASMIGARYAGCAAAEIAWLLPSVAPSVLAAPPSYSSTVERLFTISPRDWRPFSPRTTNPPEGLYREQVNGRWRYSFRRSGEWYLCDLSSGFFAELASRGKNALHWTRGSVSGKETGTFFVDSSAPLPPLHDRVLTLCSGLSPRFDADAEIAMYDNVPQEIATRVSASLGQTLSITD